MAKLTEDQKNFIVEHLACYDTPQQVADAFEAEFGVPIRRQAVAEYDPTKKTPGKKRVAMFEAIRARFLKDVSTEPASEKSYRVRRLARMARIAEEKKNFPEARAQYRQIAEEMGGILTNRRELTGAGGGPIATRSAELEDMSEAQLIALAAELAAKSAAP